VSKEVRKIQNENLSFLNLRMCTPNYNLSCQTAISIERGGRYTIPEFCSIAGPGGTQARKDACNKLGKPGEFGNEMQLGNGSCPCHAGTLTSCERLNWAGPVEPCCLVPGSCFAYGYQQGGTCDPNAREISGSLCKSFYLGYCSKSDQNTLYEKWSDNAICRRALDENLNDPTFRSNLMTGFLTSVFGAGPVPQSSSSLVDLAYNIAWDNPDASNNYLKKILCPRYTRENLSTNSLATKFCGCNLPVSQYGTFENQVGVSPACDSLCVSSQVIKDVDENGSPLYCQSNICIIDNVLIEAQETGNITFAQACGERCSGSCVCYIRDVSVSVGGTIGNIDINQQCGSASCFETLSDGSTVEVECPGAQVPASPPPEDKRFPIWAIVLIIVLVVVFFLLIFVGLFFSFRKKKNR